MDARRFVIGTLVGGVTVFATGALSYSALVTLAIRRVACVRCSRLLSANRGGLLTSARR